MTTTSKLAAGPRSWPHRHGDQPGEMTVWLLAEHLVDTALVRSDDGR